LATWAGIEYAANHHFDKFDFMGAGKPDESYGVREFKSKFGGTLLEHGRFLYICNSGLYKLGKFIVRKLRH
jgi:lipid II:glycine glycyltransferase (peptidoglycan interpeptide bridge formation enzyme)